VLLPDEFVQSARTHPGREWLRGFTGAPETVGLGRGVRGGAAELLWHALKLMAPSHCYRATTTARRVRWWVRGTRCEVGGRIALSRASTSHPYQAPPTHHLALLAVAVPATRPSGSPEAD